MSFSSEFEQMLDEYDIDVSERTRRLIRRNEKRCEMNERSRRWIRRNAKNKPVQPGLCTQFWRWIWSWIYFILSLIFKITLGIMVFVVWMCLYLVYLMMEIYCVLLIIHITTVAMKRYQ
jgi:hypothetical protein